MQWHHLGSLQASSPGFIQPELLALLARLFPEVDPVESMPDAQYQKLLRTFRDFRKARHELTICGVEALEKALSVMTESGRRDPAWGHHAWAMRRRLPWR